MINTSTLSIKDAVHSLAELLRHEAEEKGNV